MPPMLPIDAAEEVPVMPVAVGAPMFMVMGIESWFIVPWSILAVLRVFGVCLAV